MVERPVVWHAKKKPHDWVIICFNVSGNVGRHMNQHAQERGLGKVGRITGKNIWPTGKKHLTVKTFEKYVIPISKQVVKVP